MRKARQQIEPDVPRIAKIVPQRVRVQERTGFHPVLVRGVHLEDPGARVRLEASAAAAVGSARDRIKKDPVRERELALRIPSADVLTVRSCSLCKSIVEKDPAAAPEPVQDAVEDAVPLLVLVEAQMQEIAHVAGGLRDAKRVNALDIPNQWVGRAGLVAVRVPQECGEVTGGSEAQAGDQRIPRRVRELVQPPLSERCPGGQQPDTERVDILPVSGGDGHRRIVVSRTHGQAGLGLVHRRCRIGQRRDDRRGVVDDEFLERRDR